MSRWIALIVAALVLGLSMPMAEPADVETVSVYAGDGWQRDLHSHWLPGESGERLEEGAHDLADGCCTVCGTKIYVWDFGATDLYNYNELGEVTRATYYNAEGELLVDYAEEYVHDENGAVTLQRTYQDGVLYCETLYAVNAWGESIEQQRTTWFEDGFFSVEEYDGRGRLVKNTTFDEQGQMEQESVVRYAMGEDGEEYMAASESRDAEGMAGLTEYNAQGQIMLYRVCDARGSVLEETRYEYAVNDDGYEVVQSETRYEEDGSRSVITYDENYDPVREVTYLPDGSIASDKTYVFRYDEMGSLLGTGVYQDGRLVSEAEYALDEEGWRYVARETEYHEDGTATVTLYDPNGEEIPAETAE